MLKAGLEEEIIIPSVHEVFRGKVYQRYPMIYGSDEVSLAVEELLAHDDILLLRLPSSGVSKMIARDKYEQVLERAGEVLIPLNDNALELFNGRFHDSLITEYFESRWAGAKVFLLKKAFEPEYPGFRTFIYIKIPTLAEFDKMVASGAE